jgi:hypothetical protein
MASKMPVSIIALAPGTAGTSLRRLDETCFKTKITAARRDSCPSPVSLGGLRHRPDAACAQHFANHPPFFYKRNFLQIWAKGPAGGTLREAAVVTKCCGFSTSVALCHCQNPFSRINNCCGKWRAHSPGTKTDSTTIRIHFQASLFN